MRHTAEIRRSSLPRKRGLWGRLSLIAHGVLCCPLLYWTVTRAGRKPWTLTFVGV